MVKLKLQLFCSNGLLAYRSIAARSKRTTVSLSLITPSYRAQA